MHELAKTNSAWTKVLFKILTITCGFSVSKLSYTDNQKVMDTSAINFWLIRRTNEDFNRKELKKNLIPWCSAFTQLGSTKIENLSSSAGLQLNAVSASCDELNFYVSIIFLRNCYWFLPFNPFCRILISMQKSIDTNSIRSC